MAEWIKKKINKTKNKPLSMLSIRDTPRNKGHIQTENEGMEKDIPCE